MFWDGSRWVAESRPSVTSARKRGLGRPPVVALILTFAVTGIAMPTRQVAAGRNQPAATLIRAWSVEAVVKAYQETSFRVSYTGEWSKYVHPKYLGRAVRAAT